MSIVPGEHGTGACSYGAIQVRPYPNTERKKKYFSPVSTLPPSNLLFYTMLLASRREKKGEKLQREKSLVNRDNQSQPDNSS